MAATLKERMLVSKLLWLWLSLGVAGFNAVIVVVHYP